MNNFFNNKGSVLFQVLVLGGIAFMFIGGMIAWGSGNIRFANYFYQREVASNIAEGGIESKLTGLERKGVTFALIGKIEPEGFDVGRLLDNFPDGHFEWTVIYGRGFHG